ncbi:MAG: hypothetical protein ACOC9P_02475, partial [bacterium]
LSLFIGDYDLPGEPNGSNLEVLREDMPRYHDLGVRIFSGESSDNWGPNGLSYYLHSRILWDVDAVERIDELTQDFVEKAFGDAHEPMAEFYALLDGSHPIKLSPTKIGLMYRHLADAWKRTSDEAVRERLKQLILYTRYAEMMHALREKRVSGDRRDEVIEELMQHVFAMRFTQMVHSRGFYSNANKVQDTDLRPDAEQWKSREANHEWHRDADWLLSELNTFLTEGIENNPVVEVDPKQFSHDLVPATRLAHLSADMDRLREPSPRGTDRLRIFWTWIGSAPAEHTFSIRQRERKDRDGGWRTTHFRVYAMRDEDNEDLVFEQEIEADGETHDVRVSFEAKKLHRIEFGMRSPIDWPEDLPQTIERSKDYDYAPVYNCSNYFYVPRRTKYVGGYKRGSDRGVIHDAEGNPVHDFEEVGTGYFKVEVPPGHDGRLWTLRKYAGWIQLTTVPPFTAPHPEDLLLPREVVERDQ